jgi:signal peptidase I
MKLARILTVASLLTDGLLAALVIAVLACVAISSLGPPLGHPALVIEGGSMAPKIPLGSLVILNAGVPADPRVGDVVAFRTPSGTTITHRVTSVARIGATAYIGTKGDANPVADPVVTPLAAVVGEVAWTVPGAGYLVTVLARPIGLLALFLVAATLLVQAMLFEEMAAVCRAGAASRAKHRPRPARNVSCRSG